MWTVLDGRYVIGHELGHGAYGVVCCGTDIRDKRPIAVKTVDLDAIPEKMRSFAAGMLDLEISILRTLDHPNVLRAFDVIAVDVRRHVVLELCEGPDLQAVLDVRGALDFEECREVLRQCLSALRHLHSRGIVHRDVKPANIMFVEAFAASGASRSARSAALLQASLLEQTLKLVDFGLAKQLPHARRAARRDGASTPGSKHGGTAFFMAGLSALPGDSRHATPHDCVTAARAVAALERDARISRHLPYLP